LFALFAVCQWCSLKERFIYYHWVPHRALHRLGCPQPGVGEHEKAKPSLIKEKIKGAGKKFDKLKQAGGYNAL
jgi:hypothetical protein